MNTASRHRERYPNARPSTLAYLSARDRMTEQLAREVAEQRRRSFMAVVKAKLAALAINVGRFV